MRSLALEPAARTVALIGTITLIENPASYATLLDNRPTGASSTYAWFDSTRSIASWLPSQETALDWQRIATGAA